MRITTLSGILLCMTLAVAALVVSPDKSSAQLKVVSHIMNYDTTLCGTTKCRTVALKNTGATTITINSITALFPPFANDPSTPFLFPKDIAPNDSMVFTFCYSPQVSGASDSSFSTIFYDINSKDSFLLVGKSVGPKLTLNPTSLNYGVVQLFQTNCLPVTLSNTGTGTLNVGAISGIAPPFTIQTPPPSSIAAGASGSMTICYTPSASGVQNQTIFIPYNACGGKDSLAVQLQGTGSFPPKVALGPVLQVIANPTNFDTTLCGTTKCLTTVLTNTGNADLTITQFGSVQPPFTLDVNTQLTPPLTLVPNQSKSLQFCYQPTRSPALDSLVIPYLADNRVSLSIAMVFDVSGSMSTMTATPGVTRIIAANSGGKVFIDNLINDPARNIIDEAAIVKFSDNILINPDFTSNTAALNAGVPSTTLSSTRLYDALDSTIRHLKTRNQPGRRVIVLLSDGDDNTGYQQGRIDAIVAACTNDVRIYSIGIGNGLSAGGIKTLTDIANLTGGNAHFTNNPDTLVQIYRSIAVSLSKNIPGALVLRGRAVAPALTLSVPTLAFDSIKVGNSRCLPVTFTNSGDAPLHLDALPVPANGFAFDVTGPVNIDPGKSTSANLCFAPTRLRKLDTAFSFTVSPCSPVTRLAATGVGYDSVVISLRDTVIGKPGNEVVIPVRLLSKIPVEYDVNSLELTLGHNKTLLFPVSPVAVTATTATSPFITQSVANQFANGEKLSSNIFSVSGQPMASNSNDTILLMLRYTALLGDSIATPLTIMSARFADGNPKVGIINQGQFRIDSLCYLNKRLIDASSRIQGAFQIQVLPGETGTSIDYTLPDADPTTIVIYNSAGQPVYEEWPDVQSSGLQHQNIPSLNLPTGVYFLRIKSGDKFDVVSFFIHH